MQVASRQPMWNEGMPKGTVLVIRASAGSMTSEIGSGTLAPGSEFVTIDWGDGTVVSVPGIRNARHTYSRPGDYKVKISDDIQSIGYANNSGVNNDVLIEVKCVGSKVVTIDSYGFNNCHKVTGVINLPNVTTISSYAFGSLGSGVTDFIFPSMTRLVQTSFYCGCGPRTMYADNVTQIDSDFWGYYGGRLVDLYIRKKTCQQIKAMSGFPFKAGAAVRFHGSDGIVTGDGRITLG